MQPITVITLAQSIVIVTGTLFTAAFRRMRIEILEGSPHFGPPLESALSNFGLFLLVIPFAWLCLYWNVSRTPRFRVRQRVVFWLGIALIAGLLYLFATQMMFPLHFCGLQS